MGLIKKLLGGIFSFLTGIFSIFKKSEYYLEAEPKASAETPAPAKAKPEPVEVKQVESVPAATPAPATSNGKVAEPVAATTVASVAPAAPAAKAAAPAAPAAPDLFAPNNLVTNGTGSRRRPGPSMNRFIDMAKQVKA